MQMPQKCIYKCSRKYKNRIADNIINKNFQTSKITRAADTSKENTREPTITEKFQSALAEFLILKGKNNLKRHKILEARQQTGTMAYANSRYQKGGCTYIKTRNGGPLYHE